MCPPLVPELLTSCFDVLILPPRSLRREVPDTRCLPSRVRLPLEAFLPVRNSVTSTTALVPSSSRHGWMHKLALPSSLQTSAHRRTLFRFRPPLPCPWAAALRRSEWSSLYRGALLPSPFSHQVHGANRLLPAGSGPLTPGACWPPADQCARPSAADTHLRGLVPAWCLLPLSDCSSCSLP